MKPNVTRGSVWVPEAWYAVIEPKRHTDGQRYALSGPVTGREIVWCTGNGFRHNPEGWVGSPLAYNLVGCWSGQHALANCHLPNVSKALALRP